MGVELLLDLTEEMFPRVLPAGWRRAPNSNHFFSGDGLLIIASAELIAGERWWHVSLARPNRLPSWDDIRKVKDVFVGRQNTAVSVLPSEDNYVNHHNFCLHIWRCLDREIVPDMRRLGGTL
jgi:hypothetical protein